MRAPVAVIALALSAVAWSQSQLVTWLILIDDLHLQFVDRPPQVRPACDRP